MAFEVYENDPNWAETQRKAQEQASNREDWTQVKYKLNLGETKFRVLGKFNADRDTGWFVRTLEHYEPVGKSTVCPQLYSNPCPICERCQELFDEGNVELAKKYKPTQRWWVNAIVMSEQTPNGPGKPTLTPADGVYALKLPTSVKSFLLDMDTDYNAGYGNITDLENGWNVIVDKAAGFRPDAYNVKLFARPTSIVAELAEQGIDISTFTLINLNELVDVKPYEELVELMKTSKTNQPEKPAATPVKLTTVSPVKIAVSQTEDVQEAAPSMTTVKMVSPKPMPNIPKPPVLPGRGN